MQYGNIALRTNRVECIIIKNKYVNIYIYIGFSQPCSIGSQALFCVVYIVIYKLSIYIYMFTYLFFIIIHSTLFVRNAIFPYCTLVHVATLAQETRLASRTERLNGGNQRKTAT